MRCQTLCHARSLPATGWSCDQKQPTKTREEPEIGNSTDIDVAQIQFFLKMQEFMSLYSQSPLQDGINNLALTNWLLTDDAKIFDEDPEYDTP
jgi:hypothetical protein